MLHIHNGTYGFWVNVTHNGILRRFYWLLKSAWIQHNSFHGDKFHGLQWISWEYKKSSLSVKMKMRFTCNTSLLFNCILRKVKAFRTKKIPLNSFEFWMIRFKSTEKPMITKQWSLPKFEALVMHQSTVNNQLQYLNLTKYLVCWEAAIMV